MVRSLPDLALNTDALTSIAQNYIVCNMPEVTIASASDRAERVDYIAEHLLSRAALLVRLLVRQVHNREVSRTEVEVLSILIEGREGSRTSPSWRALRSPR